MRDNRPDKRTLFQLRTSPARFDALFQSASPDAAKVRAIDRLMMIYYQKHLRLFVKQPYVFVGSDILMFR